MNVNRAANIVTRFGDPADKVICRTSFGSIGLRARIHHVDEFVA